MKKTSTLSVMFLLLIGLTSQINAQNAREPGRLPDRPFGSDARSSRDLVKAINHSTTAARLITDIMETEGKNIPSYILDNARAIAVFSSGFEYEPIFGGEDARGLVSIRDPQTGFWSPPIYLLADDGPIEKQVEDKNTDVILIALDQRSANLFMSDEFELGSVLGGPFGSELDEGRVDTTLFPGFVAYFRDNEKSEDEFGSFSGTPLKGTEIRHDRMLNQAVYGEREIRSFMPVSNVVNSRALIFSDTLNRFSKKVETGV
jgi:lipid-binding SYLF domain-containing protein